jgi:response regulator RpfG family c-di-GMP phosphodiesterase
MLTITKPERKIDQPLRVLVVEDAKSDIALLLLALREGGFEVTYEAVATQAAMRAALMHHQWDVIISDHGMPQFSGPAALALTLEISPDVPFVIVSGEIYQFSGVLNSSGCSRLRAEKGVDQARARDPTGIARPRGSARQDFDGPGTDRFGGSVSAAI